MNNVYVGRRYVPKIFGVWDNSKQTSYESLSIVQWGGSSYTSKKDVPPGIDITNENYWVCTGNYNAQVEIYRKEVHDITNKVDDLSQDLSRVVLDITKFDVFTNKQLDGVKVTNLFLLNDNATFYFPKGEYELTSTISITNNVNIEMSDQCVIKAVVGMEDMIRYNKEATDYGKNRNIKGGILDGNGLARNGIHIIITSNLWIDGTRFKNQVLRGIIIDSGYELLCTNLFFNNTIENNINDNVALEVNTSDSMFLNLTMRNFTTGMLVKQGGNFISNIHPWSNQASRLPSTIGIDNKADGNFYNMIYCDTCQTGFKSDHFTTISNSIFNISRSYRKLFLTEPTYIENYGTKTIMVNDSSFEFTNVSGESYKVTVCSNNINNTVFNNCEFPTPNTLNNVPSYIVKKCKIYKKRIDFTDIGTINANDRKDIEVNVSGDFTLDYRDTVIFNHGNVEIGIIPTVYTKNGSVGLRLQNVTNNPIAISNKVIYATIIKNYNNDFLPYQ